MRQKGLAPIVTLLIVVVVLVVGGLAYYFIHNKSSSSSPSAPSTVPTVTAPATTGTSVVQVPSSLSATPYVDGANGFSINLPKGWIYVSNTSRQGQYDFSPNNSNPKEGMVIGIATTTPDRAKMMTVDYIASATLQKFQAYPGYSFISESTGTLQNMPTGDIVFSYTPSPGSVTIEIFYVTKGDAMYSVTCTAFSSAWNTDESLFEQSLQTFKFL